MKRSAIVAGIMFIVLSGVAAALVGFGRVSPPKALTSVTDPFAKMNLNGLPPLERYRARDGAELSYRTYRAAQAVQAGGNQVAVLIHGSVGSSRDMHQMAEALRSSGVTVYVPDLRGHGANYPHGDVAYVEQLDDDMTDFLHAIGPKLPGSCWTLVGFSSGGGFALRIAGSSHGDEFDRYILLSPFLRYDAPTARPAARENTAHSDSNVWYSVSVPRIVGLSIFNLFGIHHFDGLPVLAFPVPQNIEAATAIYSYRMQKSFGADPDYKADIRSVSRPMQVFVGGADELFLPEKFGEVFAGDRRDIPVTILPYMSHSDMVTKPEAIGVAVKAVHTSGCGSESSGEGKS